MISRTEGLRKPLVWGWTATAALVFLHGTYAWPGLPLRMATQFDVSGRAVSWMDKSSFYLVFFGVGVLLCNALLLIFYRYLEKIPPDLLNLPWKNYWFSDPKRKQIAYQRTALVLSGTGVFTNLILLFCLQIVCQANLPEVFLQISVGQGLSAILVLTIAFLFLIYRAFRPIR